MSAVGDARKRLAAAPDAGADVEALALPEHYDWIGRNLPLDSLGHITSCSAFGEDCGCATLGPRLAAHDAALIAAAEARGAAEGAQAAALDIAKRIEKMPRVPHETYVTAFLATKARTADIARAAAQQAATRGQGEGTS